MTEYIANEKALKDGGQMAELFCLRPKKYADEIVTIRLKVNAKWSGWKLRDELVECLGLGIGDTISTVVTVQNTDNLSSDTSNIDLFATGEGCDWLIENKVSAGSIIDCRVRFSYVKVPVGPNNKEVYDASLIFVEGLAVIETSSDQDKVSLDDNLLNLFHNLVNNE